LRNFHNASLARGALVRPQLAGRVCFRLGFGCVRNLERRAGEIRTLWLRFLIAISVFCLLRHELLPGSSPSRAAG
jgi:hypothetical protein